MCLKKQGWGLGSGGDGRGGLVGEPGQARLAGEEKEDCQLHGGNGLGSIIMEITYPGAFFPSS